MGGQNELNRRYFRPSSSVENQMLLDIRLKPRSQAASRGLELFWGGLLHRNHRASGLEDDILSR